MNKSLQFYYKEANGGIVNPVNEVLKMANEIDVTVKLATHIDVINKAGAYILVTIDTNGERFHNEIKGISNELQSDLFTSESGCNL